MIILIIIVYIFITSIATILCEEGQLKKMDTWWRINNWKI